MFINSVQSYMGAWKKLKHGYEAEFHEILDVMTSISTDAMLEVSTSSTFSNSISSTMNSIRLRDLDRAFSESFTSLGWKDKPMNDPEHSDRIIHSHFRMLDFYKNKIGCELFLGKKQFIDSFLFMSLPTLARTGVVNFVVIYLPMNSFAKAHMQNGVATFERVQGSLEELLPVHFDLPVLLLGYSDIKIDLSVVEATTEFDQLLVDQVGMTFDECVASGEGIHFDFKASLPRNETIAKEVCAFANQSNGGLLILGVSDDGKLTGIPSGKELDEMKLKIEQIVKNSCNPIPNISVLECKTFDPLRPVLVIVVSELEKKPTISNDKIFIRKGSSSQPATSDEIRNMVLTSGV